MRVRLKHDRLAALLAASRLSQNHWALRLGISRGHLSDLVNGRHRYVSARTRQRLLDVLKVSMDELFEVEADRPARSVPVVPPPVAVPRRHWRGLSMPAVIDDLRYAVRIGLRHRLMAAAVVVTMGLGIAATTSVYSIVHAVLLAPLPFDESDQVVRVGVTLRDGRLVAINAWPDIQDYRQRVRAITDISAVQLTGTTLTSGNAPVHHLVAFVDEGFDDVFRVRPALGRFFQPDEFAFGAPEVTILMHEVWRASFGADPDVVGKSIVLDHRHVRIVGVMPPLAYTYPFPGLGFLSPLRIDPASFRVNRGALWLRAVARVRPGVTLAQAQEEFSSVAAAIAADFPDANSGLGVRIERLRDVETQDARTMLHLLTAAVVVVLLVAGVNIANLLLGHSRHRAREFAVRAALGGPASRLHRQVVTESLVLAGTGGLAGLALAPMLTRAFMALYPGMLPRAAEVTFDLRVALAGVVVTMAAGVLVAVPTARRAARVDLTSDLRAGGRSVVGGRPAMGRLLIASQVALSLALVFASGLLVQTLRTLTSTDVGFRADHVTTFLVTAPEARYGAIADFDRYFASVDDAVRALPGVADVAMSSEMPYNGNSASDVFIMKERGDLGPANPQVRLAIVSPSYWGVMGATIHAGRAFTPADGPQAPRVVVINQAAADRFYPGVNPVGRRILFNLEEWEIVGVAASMRMASMATPSQPQLYLPQSQSPRRSRFVAVKSAGPAMTLEDVRRAMERVDATIAVTDFATMRERVTRASAPERFRAMLFTSLGLLALVLSALGIYSVLADTVTRQTREIGIRMALGEDPRDVRRRVVTAALGTVGIGTVAGSLLAMLAGRGLQGVLVGAQPFDLAILAAAIGVLAAVACLAAYIPARRASRVDPLVALRMD